MQIQSWIPARVDGLTALWSSTLGAEEIARRLNEAFPMTRPVSGDAVTKKARAMNLPQRPKTANGLVKPIKRPIMHRGAGFGVLRGDEPKEPTIFREDDLPVETRRRFLDLEWGQCKWPGADLWFCGTPAEPDVIGGDGKVVAYSPYCSCHMARAHQGRRQLSPVEAEQLAGRAAQA